MKLADLKRTLPELCHHKHFLQIRRGKGTKIEREREREITHIITNNQFRSSKYYSINSRSENQRIKSYLTKINKWNMKYPLSNTTNFKN